MDFAVIGFWICVLALIFKKPLMTYLERQKPASGEEVEKMAQQVKQLEALVHSLSTQVTQLNTNSEYSQKLLVMSAQKLADAEQLLIEASNQAQASIQIQETQSAPPVNAARMIEATPSEGSFGTILNDHTIRFERLLPARIEHVWQYFTSPEYLSKWLASASIEAKLGGRIELNFDENLAPYQKERGSRIIGLVNGFEPLRKLAFSWLDTSNELSAVNVDFAEVDGQTLVTLTHSRLPKSSMHEFMAGWHAHLDALAARLSNLVPPDFTRRFNQVVHKYAAMVAATIVVSGTAAASMSVPAMASSGIDDSTYQSIKVERSSLMQKYDLLWRDVDEHQRRVDELKRDNSIEAQRQLDQLDRQLEDEYKDLHQIEVEIKDLDKVLN